MGTVSIRNLQDHALVLVSAAALGRKSDLAKLHKAQFFYRHRLERGAGRRQGVPFSGSFRRHDYGPTSMEVWRSVTRMAEAGLLDWTTHPRFPVTSFGGQVADRLSSRLPADVRDSIVSIAQKIAPWHFNLLKANCYSEAVSVRGADTRIGDIPKGTEIYPTPSNWCQVLDDETLLDLAAILEQPSGAQLDNRSLEQLIAALT